MVPVLNVEHARVSATLEDYYAADYIDEMDLAKTNIDERQVLIHAGAYALGRMSDELILAQLPGEVHCRLAWPVVRGEAVAVPQAAA